MLKIGQLIGKILKGISKDSENLSIIEEEVKKEVISMCRDFPLYSSLSYK